MKVILIDEDGPSRESTARGLEGEGCMVIPFASIDDALPYIDENPVEAILVSSSLNAVSVSERISKGKPSIRSTPVVLFSEDSGGMTSKELLIKGVDAFVRRFPEDKDPRFSELHDRILCAHLRRKVGSSLNRLEIAMGSSIDGISLIGEDERISYVNRAFLDIFGYGDRDDLIGRCWQDLFPEEGVKKLSEDVRPTLMEHRNYRDRSMGLRRDGTLIPVEASITVLDEGELFVIVRDVTVQNQAEERIRNVSRNMSNLLDSIEEMVFILDVDCNISNSNRAAQERLGYSKDELRNINMMSLQIPGREEDARRTLDALRKGHKGICDIPLMTKDGIIIPAETNLIKGEWDGEEAIIGVTRDVSHRMRMENELKESELFNRTLMENVPAYIILYGDDRKIRYINRNAASELGLMPEEVLGMDILSIVDLDYKDYVDKMSKARLEGKEVPPYETVVSVKDSRKKTVVINGKRLMHHGDVVNLIVLNDITERRTAEMALSRANRKLQLLTGITRHDVLNHLTALQGFMELATRSRDEESLKRYLDKMSNTSHMIQMNIEFTKEYEKLGLEEPVWQDLHSIIHSMDWGELDFHYGIEGLSILADAMLSKVFYNLLDNTRRHGNAKKVTISSMFCGDDCCIIWEDDGVGVPHDQKERIFERGVGRNTGLGLFLTREILSITGISIKEDGVPGRGARFRLCVPAGMWRTA